MKGSKGFTLVEILVAMAVAGLLMVGAYNMLIQQQTSYETQDQVAGLQQELRMAMNLMRYDLRMIGHGVPSGTPALVSALNNEAARLDMDTVSFNANIHAATVVLPVGGSGQYFLNAGGPAVLEVASIDGFDAAPPGSGIDFIDLGTGDLIGTAALSGLTADPARLTVTPDGGLTLLAGSYVGVTYQTITYRVDASGPTPVLQRDDGNGFETLMDGLEDFQIAYAFDGINGHAKDGSIYESGLNPDDDEWIFNVPGERLPVGRDGLRMVRVTILLKNRLENRSTGR